MQNYKIYFGDTLVELKNDSNFNSDLWELIVNNKAPRNCILDVPNITEFVDQNFTLIRAAGGVVRNQKEEILLIERLGKWDLPKGKIEKGEEIEMAAVREVEEECGITAPEIESKLPDTWHVYPYKGGLALKRTFWFTMTYEGNERLTPQLEEDIIKVEWVSPSEAAARFEQNSYRSISDLAQAYLGSCK